MVKKSSLFSNICNLFFIQCKIKKFIPVQNDWGSTVGVVSSLRAGWSRVLIPVEARDFPLLQNVQTVSVTQPASYPMDTVVLPWGVKQLGHEVNRSPA